MSATSVAAAPRPDDNAHMTAAPSDDAARPLTAAERRGQIEVDTFCPGCHYNLHGQAVMVDDRLGIPVCRCPECGRFAPAGVGVTAATVWVRRLATLLLFAWVAIVAGATVALSIALGGVSAGSLGAYTNTVLVDPDGRPVSYLPSTTNGGYGGTQVIAGTATPVTSAHQASVLHPILGGPAVTDRRFDASNPYYYGGGNPTHTALQEDGPGPAPWAWLAGVSLALGTVAGGLCVSLLWHWPRRRYAWCLLVPVAPAVFLSLIYLANEQYQLIRGPAVGRAALMAAVQGLGVLIGLAVGRPLARALVRTVVPPKPRQALAFLWQVDGKVAPSAADPSPYGGA